MKSEHCHIRAPLLQTYQRSHAYAPCSSLCHTVGSIDTPLEIRLHPRRVVYLIILSIICLLETDNTVATMAHQSSITVYGKRHYLNLYVMEIRPGQVYGSGNVINTRLGRIFACKKQYVVERAEFFYCLVFPHNFFLCKNCAFHLVLPVKAAVHARIHARIGKVQRQEQINYSSEPLFCYFTAFACHRFKIRVCRRGNKSKEVIPL